MVVLAGSFKVGLAKSMTLPVAKISVSRVLDFQVSGWRPTVFGFGRIG